MDTHDVDNQVGAVAQPGEPIVFVPLVPTGAPKWYQYVMTHEGHGKHTCKCCCKTMTHNNIKAYGNLLRHFNDSKFPACNSFFQKANAGADEAKHFNQPTIDQMYTGEVIPAVRRKELDDAVVDFLIIDEQAIRMVEGEGFRNLMKKAVPYYKVPSRYIVMQEMRERLRKRQEDVKELLDSAMYVIVVLDGWSSRKMESYMGLVANLIMPNGNEHTLVLTCRHFPQRHTAVNLAKWFQEEVEHFDIKSKLIRIGTDSAANMIKAFREIVIEDTIEENEELEDNLEVFVTEEVAEVSVKLLGESLDLSNNSNSLINELRQLGFLEIHFRCAAHLLQLAIKDFLQNCQHRDFERVIRKAKEFTNFVRKSTIDSEACRNEKVTLHAMNHTRWNSMYTMIDSIIKAHSKHGLLDSLKASEKHKIRPNDIIVLRELHQLLRPLKEFTDQMQAKSLTMGLMSKGYDIVYALLDETAIENFEDCCWLIEDLKDKLNNRLGCIMRGPQTRLSACLDPRTAHGSLQIPENKDIMLKVMRVVMKFKKEPDQNISEVPDIVSPLKKRRVGFWEKGGDIADRRITSIPNEARLVREEEELGRFTMEVCKLEMQMEINPLKWWLDKEHMYPIMYRIAFIYLFGPVSTASVERLFSLTGRICSARRSCMKPETVEMIALLKSGLTYK